MDQASVRAATRSRIVAEPGCPIGIPSPAHGRSTSAGLAALAFLFAWAILATNPLAAQLAGLARQQPALVIGELDGSDEQVLGHIRGVAVDGAGNLFVLDAHAHEVRWFGEGGAFRGRPGRRGRGPGERTAPMDIALDGAGRVHVLDPANLRITTYTPRDTGLVHTGDVRVPPGYSLCAIGARRFLLLPRDEGVIHEVAAVGNVVRPFGSIESPPEETTDRELRQNPIQREIVNGGVLRCDPASGTLVLLHTPLPLVRAFAADGRPLWRTVLSGYRPIRWIWSPTEDGRPGARMGVDPATGTAHTGAALAITDDGRIIATLSETGYGVEPRLEARVLRLSDGKEIERATVPIQIAALRGGAVYGHVREPFPRVPVYRSAR